MKANEFIKRHGVEVARHYNTRYSDDFSMELKRLIESHDLSDRLGGTDTLQIMIEQMEINGLEGGMNISFEGVWQGVFTKAQLQQAIADVKACRELDCDHDWEDISTTADLERQLICTYCGLGKSEPLELNIQRWNDGGEP